MSWPHKSCNFFCRPDEGEHADVLWSSVDLEAYGTTWEQAAYEFFGGGTFDIQAEEAPEAPEYSPSKVGPYRRLIRWREAQLQVRVDGDWVNIGSVRDVKLEISVN